MGLLTLHNCHASCFLKSFLESKSRLPIPQEFGSYCKYLVLKMVLVRFLKS